MICSDKLQIGNQFIRKPVDNEQAHELPIQSSFDCWFCVDEAKNMHYPIISDASGMMIWSDEASSHDDDE